MLNILSHIKLSYLYYGIIIQCSPFDKSVIGKSLSWKMVEGVVFQDERVR